MRTISEMAFHIRPGRSGACKCSKFKCSKFRKCLRAAGVRFESASPSMLGIAGGSGPPSMTGRDQKFHERHSLQRCRISLAFVGRAKDGFGDGLHMCRTDRLGQRRNRGVQGIFHDAYRFRWKRCVRKVLHLKNLSSQVELIRNLQAEQMGPAVRYAAFRRSLCRLRSNGRD
jgi:hypothetical protein